MDFIALFLWMTCHISMVSPVPRSYLSLKKKEKNQYITGNSYFKVHLENLVGI